MKLCENCKTRIRDQIKLRPSGVIVLCLKCSTRRGQIAAIEYLRSLPPSDPAHTQTISQ